VNWSRPRLYEERSTRQSVELQLREIEQAHVEASGRLEQLAQVGFFARRRLLRELRNA
jgi:hypothetical protein